MNDDQNLTPTTPASDQGAKPVTPTKEETALEDLVTMGVAPTRDSNSTTESITDKIKKAREAMEGPERTLHREERETETRVKDEKNKVQSELNIISKKKEQLEINWVVLDKKQMEIKKLLDPIRADEEKLETEEEKLESREHTTGDIKDRQKIEQERWTIQDQRKNLEKRKWELEDKILAIEDELQKNTNDYQELLDEEEVLNKKMETLDYEVAIAREKTQLHAEEEAKRLEAETIRNEQRAREDRLRAEAEASAKSKEAELSKVKEKNIPTPNSTDTVSPPTIPSASGETASSATPANTTELLNQTAEDKLRQILADQKKRAELEMNRREKISEQPVPEKTPAITFNQDNRQAKADILAAAKVAAMQNMKPESASDNAKDNLKPVEPKNIEEQNLPITAVAEVEDILTADTPAVETPATLNQITDSQNEAGEIPSYSPNEKSSIPVIRTFKNDISNNSSLTPGQMKEAEKKFPWLKK